MSLNSYTILAADLKILSTFKKYSAIYKILYK